MRAYEHERRPRLPYLLLASTICHGCGGCVSTYAEMNKLKISTSERPGVRGERANELLKVRGFEGGGFERERENQRGKRRAERAAALGPASP